MLLAAGILAAEAWRIRLDRADAERDVSLASRAARETGRKLDDLRVRLEGAAETAANLRVDSTESAFSSLQRLSGPDGPSIAVAIFGPDSAPLVWSGRFLAPPTMAGDPLRMVRTAFYVVLEVRRHRADGGMTLAAAPIWRDTTVPAVVEDLALETGRELGVGLQFLPLEEARAELPRWPANQPVLAVLAAPPERSEAVSRHLAQASRSIAWLVLLLLFTAALAGERMPLRLLPVVLGLVLALRAPLGTVLWPNAFSAASFFNPVLGPLSGSAGALASAGGLAVIAALLVWYGVRLPPRAADVAGHLIALGTPYVTRELARGITPPATGVPLSLWLLWHFALLLPTVALVILACGLVRRGAAPGRPLWPLLGGGLSILVAAAGVLAFTGRPGWPAWYVLLWFPPILLVIRPAPVWSTLLGVSLAAGAGAGLMTWGNALTGRTDLALSDVAALGLEPDPLAEPRLADLGNLLAAGSREFDAAELYRGWRHSRLHGERYPARLMVWSNSTVMVDVALHAVPLADAELGAVALSAPPGQAVTQLAAGPGVHHVLTRRLDSARVLVVAVAPRTRLVPPATLGRVLEGEPPPLYEVSLTPSPSDSVRIRGRWRREGWALRASRRVMLPGGPHEANMVIPLGRPVTIGVRGSLLLIADVAAVVLLWLAAAGITGVPVRIRFPLFRRSYETRLALALAGFTVVPAALLSALSVRQLALEARQSRTLVLQRILRDASVVEGETVRETARRLDTSIGIYRQGRLESASEPVLPALGLLPPLLEPEAWHALVLDGDPFVAPQSQGLALTGYVPVARNGAGVPTILGTVEPLSDRELLERQLDIAFFFVLAALLGVIAALTGARFAARMLSRPVDELRHTALALGRGLPAPPRQVTPTREFEPVFDAFGRMAADVRAGRDALETARRRTEAVLATVSTGVVAVDGAGLVILANRTAEEMLGVPLARGEPFATLVPPGWQPLLRLLQADGSPPPPLELDDAGRRYAIQVAQLEAVGGWVVAINDVTQATRAARVLAWADVANQVAHAIKNPLTPLRLGIQHLQRVRHRHPEQFDTALVETSQRLLDEIERLDAIARGFSRFAAPTETTLLPDWVPLEEVAREVAALHHLAPGLAIRVEIPAGMKVKGRRDELKEVLLNLCDNSRNAGARTVVIGLEGNAMTVSDDGHGIAPEILPHIFEPRFSTTSSGSGLGLAIVRRVVEGWGASISADSEPGKGARFLIDFPEGSTIRGAAE